MNFIRFLLILSTLAITSCSNSQNGILSATNPEPLNAPAPFRIFSKSFKQGDTIPSIYTCDSSNVSPQLYWNNPPKNTVSFALIADDPDAPMGIWVHWVLYNIPANDTVLQTNMPKDTSLANGTKEGITSFGTAGYGGPCPPNGWHHYYFKVYALDAMLPYPAGLMKKQLLSVMKGHVLAEAELMGKYKKVKS
ncbi:MAG TPA: YbhB/YbcL family Raf kinase inhibitor-like protein [Bacteroidia bacterium]|jgi:Raf kinase inhibitor-like YbhB/YbcL family protein|nr:YbhB/YbcL family Raf kinase inhibitor-like protein [Bacteroidia bacterium]